MASLFKTTFNTRWLPTGDHRYIRTDYPGELTDEEVEWLRSHNVLTVVDLRKEEEYSKLPCRLENEKSFTYYHLPVSGGDVVPKTPEDIIKAYLFMIDKDLDNIVDTILNAKTGVIYFCASGKDRTGVTSAAILRRLGFDDKTIIDDYMISRANLIEYAR